jgi:dTDP-4-dehydrorhamnose reductase
MVGSHYVQHSGQIVHAAGRTDPGSLGVPVNRFSSVRLEEGKDVEALVRSSHEPVVVNFAARTDVDAIERERGANGQPAAGDMAWRINALAPEAMARAAAGSGKYLIQISTDFVFDGEGGPYGEKAPRSPFSKNLSWYGWTKSEGERRVEIQDPTASVLRISYPFRSAFPRKLDFARGIFAKRQSGNLPAFYADQRLTPTWVPDVTQAVARLADARAAGIYHAASPDSTTPYEFAERLFRLAPGPEVTLHRGSLATTLGTAGATPRPLNGGLRCHSLPHLGANLTGWREAMDRLVAEEGWG